MVREGCREDGLWGGYRKESEEAGRLTVPLVCNRVEGKMGAHKIKGGCFTRHPERQAQEGGFGPVGNRGRHQRLFESVTGSNGVSRPQEGRCESDEGTTYIGEKAKKGVSMVQV